MAAFGRIHPQAKARVVAAGGGERSGERVARCDRFHSVAQAQVGLLEGPVHRRHVVAQREVGAVGGEQQHPLVIETEHHNQRRCAVGRIRGGDGADLERALPGRDFEDLALVVAEFWGVGRRNDAVGAGRKCLLQHRAGAVPHEHRDERGEAGLPGAAARRGPQPDRCGDDEEDAEDGADGIGDDVADARVAARDVLLQEFDCERQQPADRDDATRQDAGEGERDAERDEENEVLDQLGEGGVAGGEAVGPAVGQVVVAMAQGKEEDGGCGEDGEDDGDAFFHAGKLMRQGLSRGPDGWGRADGWGSGAAWFWVGAQHAAPLLHAIGAAAVRRRRSPCQ